MKKKAEHINQMKERPRQPRPRSTVFVPKKGGKYDRKRDLPKIHGNGGEGHDYEP